MIKTDISGKWVSREEVDRIIRDCVAIALAGMAAPAAQVIKERYLDEKD